MTPACLGQPIAVFYPIGNPTAPPDFETPLALCRRCPLVLRCQQKAEEAGDIVDGYTVHGQVVGGCGPKGVATALANCGTASGYKQHRRRGEPACGPCNEANTALSAARRGRIEPRHGTPAGYKQHKRLGEDACLYCLQANVRYVTDSKRKGA